VFFLRREIEEGEVANIVPRRGRGKGHWRPPLQKRILNLQRLTEPFSRLESIGQQQESTLAMRGDHHREGVVRSEYQGLHLFTARKGRAPVNPLSFGKIRAVLPKRNLEDGSVKKDIRLS